MDIAIITGASSGMGRQFVLQAAAMEHYDEIWVIARREERLEELAQMTKTPLRILALDLKESDSLSQIKKMLEERKPLVRLLVNAAGFGKFGPTAGLSDEEVSDMVQLNVYALAVLTKAVLPYMKSGGRIIQMASVAAFQPLPDMNIYAASKAFVLSFSRALGRELGLPVMQALCKIRETPRQMALSGGERRKNLKNAFSARPDALLEGKRILLVDDVLTTGSTLNECAKALRAAGAAECRGVCAAATR